MKNKINCNFTNSRTYQNNVNSKIMGNYYNFVYINTFQMSFRINNANILIKRIK